MPPDIGSTLKVLHCQYYEIKSNKKDKKMRLKLLLLLLIFPALLLSSCSKDDDTSSSSVLMEIEKDGEKFEVTTFTNRLVFDQQSQSRALLLVGSVDGGSFTFTITNWDWQNPPENGIVVKTYDTNVGVDVGSHSDCMTVGIAALCDGGQLSYVENGATYISDGVENEEEGQIIISGNDTSSKTVSGSFDIIVQELGIAPNRTKITFKGSFINLPYQ